MRIIFGEFILFSEDLTQLKIVGLPPWFPIHALSRKVDTFVIIVLYLLGEEYSDDRDFQRQEREHMHSLASREAHRYEDSAFLSLPTKDEELQCYQNFYNGISMDALRSSVCAVCARDFLNSEQPMHQRALDSLPHRERLIPVIEHPAQDRYDQGELLEPRGVFVRELDFTLTEIP